MALKRKTRTKTKKQPVLSKRQEPDIRAEAGEGSSIEKVALENQQLREATKRLAADLKQKTRDLEVEAALERVRASSMAMHHSSDLHQIINAISVQLHLLNFRFNSTNFILVNPDRSWDLIISTPIQPYPANVHFPYYEHRLFDEVNKAIKDRIELYAIHLNKEEKNNVMKHIFENMAAKAVPEERKQFVYDAPSWELSVMPLRQIVFAVSNYEDIPYSSEENAIIKRFGSVFEQSYTRFLDLQKAEAQAREAQIEAALERVRSRMMAMHQSEDLPEVMKVITEQFTQLGFDIHAASFLPDITNTDLHCWISTPEKTFPVETFIPYFDHVIFNRIREVVDSKLDFLVLNVSEEDTRSWWNNFLTKSNVSHLSERGRNIVLNISMMSVSMAVMKYTLLTIWNYRGKPFSEEENAILKRFAKVAEQTYTRYLELRKAEAQAREATIQASLERVRAKAMGMHNSQDLAETIHAFYNELVSMNLTPRRCGIGLVEKETRLAELSSMNTTEDGISVETIGIVKLDGHPVLAGIYDHWLEQKEYHPILRGKEIKEYYQLLRKQINVPDYPTDAVHFGYFFMFQEGGVYAWTEKELQEDELNIYRRFTSVISLTYKRYKDLKDSEARAKEALKQTSLDRVRAEIASMRSKEDLDRITPLIWRELTTLGIPFVRCGVFIMHEDQKLAQVFLSTPDGRAIATFHLPYHAANIAEAVNDWREKRMYKAHWGTAEFSSLADTLIEGGQIANREQYLDTLPKEGIFLNYLPFLQGMLYVGHTGALSDDDLNLVQSVADAFSTAYARYEDFNKLESAKAQIENTLTDLKQTQTQLVQSEKMASLGELTAGIAHEIQNPLNFVNNFSEVSKELLDEMKAELATGNWQPATEIAESVIQNLEKINFHGKRADGIVKSMLQHSRKSTGQKEPTDINALCDEYLRLSYHGLRAKDKSFNAKFETELDPSVGKLNVLPQEIGRVILNLINNAFYAVSEKKKLNLNNYEPTVTVATTKTEKKIEVRVRDNGIGIPQKVLDKIFNPFFTTKPTGQGTGLGLSLSYDIITKGHGGELKVETKEGEGSEFIIQLPIH